ncbi:NUDIX hydrolase [Streptacidiphilus sp. MAP5-52]|uniref:NUDIX hydrolase n=1 Tax=Streptacidiphilus sp. MAP5-52 TaxID=3156267 RepID=UPI0035133C30
MTPKTATRSATPATALTTNDAYARLRGTHPHLFINPDDDGIVILDSDQAGAAIAEAAARGEHAQAQYQAGVVYSDPYITLVRDPVRFPTGRLGLYLRVVQPGPPGVAMLPLTESGEVILIEHYRHATRCWSLEIPRGFGDARTTEDLTTATINSALRELHEELGATARELLPLGTLHPDTGLLASPVHLFAARIATPTGPGPDAAEGIRRIVTVTATQAEDLVRTQAITCGYTISALYRARLRDLLTT